MSLSESRAKLLADYLGEDKMRARDLLELEPDDAIKIINNDGFDFTAEELIEFGDIVVKSAAQTKDSTELDESNLDEVSGGVVGTAIGIGVGFVAGYLAARKW